MLVGMRKDEWKGGEMAKGKEGYGERKDTGKGKEKREKGERGKGKERNECVILA
jgi:hypothetical protein